MRQSRLILVVASLVAFGLPLAVAQEPAAKGTVAAAPEAAEQPGEIKTKPPATEPATPAPLSVDPTIPSEQMKAILGQQRLVQPGTQTKLPSLRIKGRVVSPKNDVLVLLQVGQQIERVSADAEWTTDDGLTIKVLSVSVSELRLQIQPLNRTVTVR